MKLGPVNKIYKKTRSHQKNLTMSLANCNTIVNFSIYGQFGAIRKSDSEYINCKTYILFNSNLLSYKN